jgi:hypothetical protein
VPGATVVRYALPAGVLQKLRTSAAVSNVLTLSPLSTDRKATGTPVSLKVTVQPVKKTTKKHKTKK